MKAYLASLAAALPMLSAELRVGSGAPTGHAFDGRVAEWQGVAHTAKLTSLGKGRAGRIWIRQVEEGLVIAGEVDGGSPDFARTGAAMAAKDHVEVWLAAANDPVMPPVGWGNQFGETTLASAADCDKAKEEGAERELCRAWFRTVPAHRAQVRRAFVRQYQLAPDIALETFSRPAIEQIQRASKSKEFADLLPAVLPEIKAVLSAAGYTFEILIPWKALPPVSELDLKSVRFMLDVFNAHAGPASGQPFSSTSGLRRYGQPQTFDTVRLEQGRRFQLTACEYPLQGFDMFRKEHPAWFIPSEAGHVTETLILVNTTAGYQYSPDGLSPTLRSAKYFETRAGTDRFLCGPKLRYKHGTTAKQFDHFVHPDGFEARTLPNGALLVKSGPRVWFSEFGSGQCGACPRVALDMRLIAGDVLTEALSVDEVLGAADVEDADVHVSPDWKTVTVYRHRVNFEDEKKTAWSTTVHCLQPTGDYKVCGLRENSGPPAKRILKIQE